MRTYGEAKEHLIAVMDFATSERSRLNPSLTKEQAWNICMNGCIAKNDDDEMPDLIANNILKEFPKYITENESTRKIQS